MLKFFFKPKIKATLIRGDTAVKVAVKNATSEQIIIILFLTIKQIAKSLGMEQRQLMNRLIDLDKTIVREKNRLKKEMYKQEQEIKHQR